MGRADLALRECFTQAGEITERLLGEIEEKAKAKEAELGPETTRQVEKMVLLHTLDHLWREHLVVMEHLRSVIGFRGSTWPSGRPRQVHTG